VKVGLELVAATLALLLLLMAIVGLLVATVFVLAAGAMSIARWLLAPRGRHRT